MDFQHLRAIMRPVNVKVLMNTQAHSTCNISSGHPCPVCGEQHFDTLFSAMDFDSGKEPFRLTKCVTCDLVRTEPIRSDSEIEQYYDLSYYGGSKKKFIDLAEVLTCYFSYKRACSLLSQTKRTQKYPENYINKMLDIGCGRGNLLKILKRMGCECYGLERAGFPGDYPDHDIHFYSGSLQECAFTENFFDGVVIWHVLEHLDNPMKIIQETTHILRPGGTLAIAVPNFGSFQALLFRESWFHLDLPRHRYHFTSDTLLQLLHKNGFDIVSRHTFSIEQNPFGFIQSFFNKVMSSTSPNHFYSLLKNKKGASSTLRLLLWATFATLILPFAFFEYLISGVLGKGATCIIYAKKC